MREHFLKIIISALIIGTALHLAGCEEESENNTGGILVIDNTGDDDHDYLFEAVQDGGEEAITESIVISDTGDEADDGDDTDAGDETDTEDATYDDKDASDEEGKDGEESEDTADDTEEIKSVTPGSVEQVGLNAGWKYADFSKINSGTAALYRAADNRKNVVIGVNAGHGTKGGQSVKTYCHPDKSPKVTGGSTAAGSIEATAVAGGMSFNNGSSESSVTLRTAQLLRDRLLADGYDVLMLRDGSDVQLDNIARTVIANNNASCHIALHFDGDGLTYDKGCFYISTPDGIKGMEPVSAVWQQHEALGTSLIAGLKEAGCKINGGGSMAIDLTQTSYSTIPSVDIELGNQASATDDASLSKLADGLCRGIEKMY